VFARTRGRDPDVATFVSRNRRNRRRRARDAKIHPLPRRS
jgi:hypothetical protein